MRRRLAPAAARPIVPPVLPSTARVTIAPSMAETLPAEAAAAFPGLDLTLPDSQAGNGASRRRAGACAPSAAARPWAAAPGVPTRSWHWRYSARPSSLRPGATLGAPHAF